MVTRLWATTRFASGDALGLVSRDTIGLIETVDDDLRATLWSLVAVDAPLDEILDGLTRHGLKNLPSFALARFEGESQVRIVVRGAAAVDVIGPVGGQSVVAGNARTWLEQVVDEPTSVSLSIVTADVSSGRAAYHVLAGAVPASSLTRVLADADPHAVHAEAGWVSADIEPASSDTSPSSPAPTPDAEPEQSPLVPVPRDFADATLLPSDIEALQQLVDLSPLNPVAEPLREPVSAKLTVDAVQPAGLPPPLVPEDGDEAGGADYDFIYGRTVARSVQSAAVQVSQEPEEPAPSAPAVAGNLAVTPPQPPTSELIDGIPFMPGAAAVVEGQGDHDGKTISKADLLRLRGASADTAGSAPVVQAALCLQGHPNPPHLGTCRLCGSGMSASPPVMVPRPVFAQLRFSTGLVAPLDKPVLIGRSPKVEGNVGSELPNLIRLEQCGQGLSRRHAAVHLEGWQVLLEDLNSANGTVVALPGRPARRLHAGEPVMLEPGTVVDLGGEVTFSYEYTH